MSSKVDISVVIGFRNWGQRRLQLAVKSIIESFGALTGEVIVSDYGSDDGQVTREGIEEVGARYVYTAIDGPWSRSRALNAGFANARGKILVSTDADMIFSPRSFEIIGKTLLTDPSLCVLLQCRDLPSQWSDEQVAEKGFQWETFESVSRLRPRWGMGGMMAVSREAYTRIRGLDERMHTYGGEDIDFATRAKRSGQRLLWIDNPEVRMYHMWHTPTRAQVEVTEEAREAIQFNKNIVYSDKTFIRNVKSWTHRIHDSPPLVSVAIATHNRAEYLKQSITSVLGQTMQDFEIVVVDDGSDDDTKHIVMEFNDPRIRYFYQDQAGVASARNLAADRARGVYTAVHDDDDLMTPWRLESQLRVLEAGLHGSFGSFVNFDDETGQMHLFRSKALNPGTIDETGGAPGHGTWLVETEIIRRLRYDESLSSGVDNNLALRIVRSGFKLVHCGEILMLRRLHPGQITVSDEHIQKLSARQTRQLFSFGTTAWGTNKMKEQRGANDWTSIRFADALETLIPYLPDHLVSRHLPEPAFVAGDNVDGDFVVSRNARVIGKLLPSTGLTYADMANITKSSSNVTLEGRLRAVDNSEDDVQDSSDTIIQKFIRSNAEKLMLDHCENDVSTVVVITGRESLDASIRERFDIVDELSISFEGRDFHYSFALDGQDMWKNIDADQRYEIFLVLSNSRIEFSSLTTSSGFKRSNEG